MKPKLKDISISFSESVINLERLGDVTEGLVGLSDFKVSPFFSRYFLQYHIETGKNSPPEFTRVVHFKGVDSEAQFCVLIDTYASGDQWDSKGPPQHIRNYRIGKSGRPVLLSHWARYMPAGERVE